MKANQKLEIWKPGMKQYGCGYTRKKRKISKNPYTNKSLGPTYKYWGMNEYMFQVFTK